MKKVVLFIGLFLALACSGEEDKKLSSANAIEYFSIVELKDIKFTIKDNILEAQVGYTSDYETKLVADVTFDFKLSANAVMKDITARKTKIRLDKKGFTYTKKVVVVAQDKTQKQYSIIVRLKAGDGAEIRSFKFLAEDHAGFTKDIVANITNQVITAVVPASSIENLKATFQISDYASVKVKNVLQISGITVNNFIGDVVYTVSAQNGSKKDYILRINTFIEKQHFKVNSGNAKLPVWIRGNTTNRALLVMVSGGPGAWGHSYMYMDKLTTAMESKYTMVYWDQRGASHIDTGGDGPSELTVKNCVKDLGALVRENLKPDTRGIGYFYQARAGVEC